VETQKLVEQSVEIVHSFARDLRPPALDHLGLLPALKSLIDEFTNRTDLEISLTAFPQVEKLASGQRIVLYRVIQSALSNVAKHAQAHKVEIMILQEVRHVCLTIADDGKSFDTRRLRYTKGDRRLGLLGMRERIEMIGGSFKIHASPGCGTTLTACIPMKTRAATPAKDAKPQNTDPGRGKVPENKKAPGDKTPDAKERQLLTD
jgi:two-component system sensor histidine kinase DegS